MAIHGVYVGNELGLLSNFVKWAGIKPGFVEAHGERGNWNGFQSTTGWLANDAGTIGRGGVPLYWSVPLIVEGTTLAEAAKGSFNSQYEAQARTILAGSPGADPIWVRTGWEHNASGNGWQVWNATGKEEAYKGAFRQFVDSFRKVSNRFRFIYCPNQGQEDAWKSYPGRDWVDVISSDIYWKYLEKFDSSDPVKAWESHLKQPQGWQWVVDAAKQEGKLAAFDEVGVTGNNAGPYLERAFAFVAANPIVHHVGWWISDAAYPGNVMASGREASGKTFIACLKAAASGATPSPQPAEPAQPQAQQPAADTPAAAAVALLATINDGTAKKRGAYPEPANGIVRQIEHQAWVALVVAGQKTGPAPAGEDGDALRVLAGICATIQGIAAWPAGAAEAAALLQGYAAAAQPILAAGGALPAEPAQPEQPEQPAAGAAEIAQLRQQVQDLQAQLTASGASLQELLGYLANDNQAQAALLAKHGLK